MVTTTRVRLDRICSSTRNAAPRGGGHRRRGDRRRRGLRAGGPHPDRQVDATTRSRTSRGGWSRSAPATSSPAPSASRRALRGYAGEVPSHIAVGDTIDVLNLGGILGRCTSANPDIGPPFQAEVLGAVLAFPELGDRVGRPAHIRDGAIPASDALELEAPVVYVAGTCMNAGKTVAATELVRGLARARPARRGGKLTGVSLMRDTLPMQDAGAVAALTFNDAGAASTHAGMTVPVATGLFNHLRSAVRAGRDRGRARRRHPRRVRRAGHPPGPESVGARAAAGSWPPPTRWAAGARTS